MKFLPTVTSARRNLRGDDAFGRGLDVVITVVLFLGLGWLIDRWLGTTPWFAIGLFVLASIGSFVGMKARYTARMQELEAERAEKSTAHREPGQAA
jgi:ATP synthase protein I